MRATRGLATIAVAAAFAVVATAAAQPAHPAHPSHPAHPRQPSTSHRCAGHKVAYVASGKFVSWTATQHGSGTWTGTVTVHVMRSNHHAAGAKGTDVTYTLSNARVTLGNDANPPTAGDPVHVIGKISEVGKKCMQSGFMPTITVQEVNIHALRQ
jgi:hypothetical protein